MNGRKLRVMRWFLLLLATLCLFFIAHKRLTFAFIETGCKCESDSDWPRYVPTWVDASSQGIFDGKMLLGEGGQRRN